MDPLLPFVKKDIALALRLRFGFARWSPMQRRLLPAARAAETLFVRATTGSGKSIAILAACLSNSENAMLVLPNR